jgi:NAD(P)-dependent dehydrogenase (short-subunit alcohol dehydrogenase family)
VDQVETPIHGPVRTAKPTGGGARTNHLAGRVAVVTGAGRGIGRAHALRLASHGAAVVVNDLGSTTDGRGADEGPAALVVAEIEAAGGAAVADAHDVASFDGGAAIVERAVGAFGRIDIVVANAGILGDAPIGQLTEDVVVRLLGVHYLGTLGVCAAAVPFLLAQRWGRVITTTSEAALDSRFRGGIAYGGAKAAVWAATVAMAAQLEGTGVTANCLSPGARTRMNDELFAAAEPTLDLDPDHVAVVAAALAGPAAAHLNGVVVHAAAGKIREYRMSRTAATDAVRWLDEEVRALG